MPRAVWSGAISFGLVNVPVKLYSATSQKDIRFHQFEEGTGQRVRSKRVAEDSGEEVDYDEIVKGYEIAKGRFVMVTPEELASVDPEATRTIDIEDFVDFTDVDPVHFEKTYFLEPSGGKGADKAYALLREAMNDSGRVAIGRFVMRTKEYLCAIRPADKALLLETMFFPDEVRNVDDLDLPAKVKLTDRETKVAGQLVSSLSADWDPDRYSDTYRKAVLALIKRKDEGEDVVVEKQPEPAKPVSDLLAALEASIADARAAKGSSPKKRAATKASAKKSASKKGSAKKRAPKKQAAGKAS